MERRPGQTRPSRQPSRTRGAQHPPSANGNERAPNSKTQPGAADSGANGGPPPEGRPDSYADDGPDPLGDFLDNRARAHEELGEPIPDVLLRNAALGAGLMVLAALIFSILPDPNSMRGSWFLLVGERTAANLTEMGKGVSGTLAGVGALLLAVNGLLAVLKPRLPVQVHYACAGQLGLGACVALPTGLTVAILLGSLAFWLGLGIMVVAALGSSD